MKKDLAPQNISSSNMLNACIEELEHLVTIRDLKNRCERLPSSMRKECLQEALNNLQEDLSHGELTSELTTSTSELESRVKESSTRLQDLKVQLITAQQELEAIRLSHSRLGKIIRKAFIRSLLFGLAIGSLSGLIFVVLRSQ